MTNEEKANEIARDMLPYNNAEYHACYNSAMKAMQWKDEQLIEYLAAFAQHLNKRGAFRDDLCMDFEHEAQSFVESQMEKRKKS